LLPHSWQLEPASVVVQARPVHIPHSSSVNDENPEQALQVSPDMKAELTHSVQTVAEEQAVQRLGQMLQLGGEEVESYQRPLLELYQQFSHSVSVSKLQVTHFLRELSQT